MNVQACLPEDIIDLNKTKEYTLISMHLLEAVLTDIQLSAHAAKLWQILFNKARYNPKLEIKISYSYLAKTLGKSARTIARYIDVLVSNGYLVISHNFDKNGSQRPSTISVRVPETVIEKIRHKKDRFYKDNYYSDVVLVTSSIQSQEKTSLLRNQTLTKTENVLHGTFIDKHPSISPEEHHTLGLPFQSSSSIITLDKTDRGGHDKNVLHKDNNKKAIYNNNNTNVVSFQEDTLKAEVSEYKTKIRHLENALLEGTERITLLNDHESLYEQLRENTRLEGQLNFTRNSLNRIRDIMEKNMAENNKQQSLQNDATHIFNKPGDRCVSSFTFKRLIKNLESYGYYGSDLNSLINEIMFEVRFGSLKTCNKTKMSLSLDKAINIALKIVRENRWVTPHLFESI